MNINININQYEIESNPIYLGFHLNDSLLLKSKES